MQTTSSTSAATSTNSIQFLRWSLMFQLQESEHHLHSTMNNLSSWKRTWKKVQALPGIEAWPLQPDHNSGFYKGPGRGNGESNGGVGIVNRKKWLLELFAMLNFSSSSTVGNCLENNITRLFVRHLSLHTTRLSVVYIKTSYTKESFWFKEGVQQDGCSKK